jgi:hypothetical protein
MNFKELTLADVSVETKVETLGIVLDQKLAELSTEVSRIETIVGPQGAKGDTGDKGPKGDQGKDGLAGKDGKNGTDGKDGQDGQDGDNGVSIQDIEIDIDDTLRVTLTDGSTLKTTKEVKGPKGDQGPQGLRGSNGNGVVVGGSTGQVLAKVSNTDYDVTWVAAGSGGGSGTVTSVAATAGTGISITGSPITTSGTLNITNTAPDQTVAFTNGTGISVTGTYPNFTVTNTSPSSGGTVTSVTGTAPVVSSGGNTPAISMAKATTTVDGYLSATDWTTFNNKAAKGANTDITSVALTTGTISTAPSSSTDIVNKSYADSIASGVNFHAACNYATTAELSTNTYNNGASGIGATLTAAVSGALSIDGSTPAVGNRILVKNEVTQANNGVYVVTQVGSGVLPYILTRAIDYDSSGSGTNEVDQGDLLLVISGTTNANTSWVQQTPLPITIGTTAIVFIQFAAIQTYTAGTGLTLATNQFSITNTGTAGTYGSATLIPVITTNAQGQVTSVTTASNPQGTVTSVGGTGTVNGLTLTGTVTASGDLTLGGTLNLSSPPAIGSTSANTGAFTSLACTSVTDTSVLGRNAGRTANTSITNQATFTTGGLTLVSQTAAVGSTWRIRAFGQFDARNNATARTAQVACFWGTTQLVAITPSVLVSTLQTTQWQVEFTLTASSTTAIWTAGTLLSRIASATALAVDNAVPASTAVTAGAQTLDLRFRVTTGVANEGWIVQSVTMERLE